MAQIHKVDIDGHIYYLGEKMMKDLDEAIEEKSKNMSDYPNLNILLAEEEIKSDVSSIIAWYANSKADRKVRIVRGEFNHSDAYLNALGYENLDVIKEQCDNGTILDYLKRYDGKEPPFIKNTPSKQDKAFVSADKEIEMIERSAKAKRNSKGYPLNVGAKNDNDIDWELTSWEKSKSVGEEIDPVTGSRRTGRTNKTPPKKKRKKNKKTHRKR